MTRKERYNYIIDYFTKEMPDANTELHFNNNFQLLVAVVLSAQCTDKRVNEVTPELFRAYPDAAAMAEAEEFEIFEYVKSVSYPNSKAAHLSKTAKILTEKFGGEIPSDIDSLLTLPGVGRKTANVIMSVAFGKAAMAVDTHVYRVSHRLGLVPDNADTPRKVEENLVKNLPEDLIPRAHHWLILHGRYICVSRKPKCDKCPFDSICPKKLDNSKLE